jgi:hypothetical protein
MILMLDSLLNLDPDTKKKLTNIISNVLFPIKCYSIFVIILLVFITYYLHVINYNMIKGT